MITQSKIAPTIWHFPKDMGGSVIICIDKQKLWESVHDFSERVIKLVEAQKMSEKYDAAFMCRVFVGGLREDIQDILLEKGIDFTFREAVFNSELLEYTLKVELEDELMRIDDDDDFEDAGSGPIFRRARAMEETPKLHIVQDGVAFYGDRNDRVDRLYRGLGRGYLKILYR